MPKPPENLSERIPEIVAPTVGKSKAIGELEQSGMIQQMNQDILQKKGLEELEGMTQDRGERKSYANKAFRLVCFWIFGVFCLLIVQGFLSRGLHFHLDCLEFTITFALPDSVLLAVVSGTTVSVIGIFLVVANYLFPRR